jgi:hypothetical protein
MHRSKLTLAILITATLAATIATAAPRGKQHEGPQRLVAVTEQGSVVTLRLENGSTIDVPSSAVMMRDLRTGAETRRLNKSVNATPDQASSKRRGSRIADLSRMSASSSRPLTAAVKIRYAPDGSVRRARIMVFESDAATQAFITEGARRARSAETRSPNQ